MLAPRLRTRAALWLAGASLLAPGLVRADEAPTPAGDPPAEEKIFPPEPASVRVLTGRAQLLEGAEVELLSKRSERRQVDGAGYLELGPRSTVELAWAGRASVRLSGPAAIEWTPPDREGRLRLTALRVGRLDLEVRRGLLELDCLQERWRLELAPAAVHLSEGPGGGLDVHHRAGKPLRVRSTTGRPVGRWPARIAGGERVALPGPNPQ